MGDVQQLSSIWCTPLKDNLITKKIKQNNSADKIDIYYEQQIRKDACKYVTTFDTFVDVGANIGIWTMPLKSKFKTVIAFEPCSENLKCLYRNIQESRNVYIHETALGDRNEIGHLRPGGTNCGNTQVVGGVEAQRGFTDKKFAPVSTVKVEIKTLDSYNLENIDLLKIDTQGHEWYIINGALESIKRCKPVIVFESDGKAAKGPRRFGKGERDTIKLLKSIGMRDVTSNTKTEKIFVY